MSFSNGSVIVAGARTPMGRLQGSLKSFSAADLGGVAIKAALERAGVDSGNKGADAAVAALETLDVIARATGS